MSITGITSEHREKIRNLILDKLNDFWEYSPDEQRVPIELPDGIASMAEQACDWIAYQCDVLATKIAEEN